MKKLASFLSALIIVFMVSTVFAEQNVSGIWVSEGSGVSNAQLIYAQNGTKLQVAGYFEVNGSPYVWHGTGTVKGNVLEYSVLYSKNPDSGDGPNGRHVMTLSPDGKTVSGKWFNNYGKSGTGSYVKQK